VYEYNEEIELPEADVALGNLSISSEDSLSSVGENQEQEHQE
jgi:hypothetical protein